MEKKRILISYLYLLLYKIVIEFVYIYGISPTYSYSGLEINMNFSKLFYSLLTLFILVLILSKNTKNPSYYIYIILILFIFIPNSSYMWLNNQSINFFNYQFISFLILGLLLNFTHKKITITNYNARFILKLLFISYIIVTIIIVFIRGGIDNRALNFDSIYELRSENNISGVLSYINNWVVKVLFPLFFSIFIYKKNFLLAFLVSILQVIMFLSFGNKAFLFSIGIILFLFYAVKTKFFIRTMSVFMSLLILGSHFIRNILDIDELFRAIPYRMIFIPAQLQYQYYDYFSVREKIYFADGLIGKILSIQSPYPYGAPYMISTHYYDAFFSANTGIFADAYTNGGVVYMIICTLILVLLLVFIDKISSSIPLSILIGSMGYMLFVINDTGLLTTLLTGGLLFQLLIFIVLNSAWNNYLDE
ncbi:hypothetical protein CW664_00345 [Macrococcoides caseolyticum]|uniref:hypothetical protein n=1 Tax=Macrococcoides caseolyticum TaxID=69966 RepID=UPI000C344D4E|nr:hypothetical protein [Macrococcus caseolyticus]PKF46220.1 hypothetical protein CW664_00345 [Macrococcus caseolyticus]